MAFPSWNSKSVNEIRFVTDSAGVAAIDAPELLNGKIFLSVKCHGYELPADGFGFRGVRIDANPGGSATVSLTRKNLAERLYRVTGGGIYADSLQFGDSPPITKPLLNAGVLGQDSVQSAIYRGQRYCFYGDTNLPGYPLGVFDTTGAISQLPGSGGLNPDVGLNLAYFQNQQGLARAVADMPGEGPTWISGPIVLQAGDQERMYATYTKIKPPLTAYHRGLCRWNDETESFEHLADYPAQRPENIEGHALLLGDEARPMLALCRPFPLTRFPATVEALADLDQWESLTCLTAGNRPEDGTISRNRRGEISYKWQRDSTAVDSAMQNRLVKAGKLAPHRTAPSTPRPRYGASPACPPRERELESLSQALDLHLHAGGRHLLPGRSLVCRGESSARPPGSMP